MFDLQRSVKCTNKEEIMLKNKYLLRKINTFSSLEFALNGICIVIGTTQIKHDFDK